LETSRHFHDRVFSLLERVEYRRAETPAEKAAIFAMRHEAYTRAGTIDPRPSGLFHDPMDETPNVWLVGLFIDGDLAGSLRLHVSAGLSAPLPATEVYPDLLTPLLESGRTLIDGTRFVSKLEYSQRYPEMPYIVLRPTFLAEEHFSAELITVACRVEHQAFYRRMYRCIPWAEAREYPNLNKPMAFLRYECRNQREALHKRYPYYRSSESELARLFERSSNLSIGVRKAIGYMAESELTDA
jgi:hypothetical protein